MVFASAVALVSLLLAPSFVYAAPWPQTVPKNTVIPQAPTDGTPVAAIDAAFKSLRTSRVSTQAAVVITRNDLIDGKCAPIIVVFARGTSSPGNVGDGVGPSFFDAIEARRAGSHIVQGVNNYPADVFGYLGGGSDSGAKDMAASVSRAASQCKGSKVVLSGYSQGAQVVHKAAKLISTSLYPNIGAIVLFGDPNNGTALPGSLNANVKTFCYDDDLICKGWPIPLESHGTYGLKAGEAAEYVLARV